ncbi:EamA family transporter [Schnuerera sp. xch1]|uniref:EamA family transporter n=1 Tax=Schnuerera sp. xch1 TaxID=2874283 RepID=UPI001CBB0B69|nr:EamA family transporter [Schnuerera sp. xch1]MBZ2175665.1 EamA family transporter [Schnuerera sp. xch1]
MDEKTKENLATGIGVFIFGINFVSMKFLVDHIPNFSLIFFRFAIASISLLVIDKIRIYKGRII